MTVRFYILGLAAAALIAIPVLTYLPEPLSLLILLILTLIFPFVVVWLLQWEMRKNQQ